MGPPAANNYSSIRDVFAFGARFILDRTLWRRLVVRTLQTGMRGAPLPRIQEVAKKYKTFNLRGSLIACMFQDGRLPSAHGPHRAPGDDLRVPGDGPGPLGEGIQRGGVPLGDDAQRGLRSKERTISLVF